MVHDDVFQGCRVAYTMASADIKEAKNHVIASTVTKSLDMKMTVPEVP